MIFKPSDNCERAEKHSCYYNLFSTDFGCTNIYVITITRIKNNIIFWQF